MGVRCVLLWTGGCVFGVCGLFVGVRRVFVWGMCVLCVFVCMWYCVCGFCVGCVYVVCVVCFCVVCVGQWCGVCV